MRKAFTSAVFVGAASLVLSSCTATSSEIPSPSEPQDTPTQIASPAVPAASPTPGAGPSGSPEPVEVPEQFQFEATTLDGAAFSGSSLYGTPTVLWFWAPWCSVCQAEAPFIADALDEFPEGVQFFGVPGNADTASMRAFVADYGLEDMIQIVDSDGSLWSNFSVTYQPVVAVIDADGKVRLLPGSIGKAALLEEARSIA